MSECHYLAVITGIYMCEIRAGSSYHLNQGCWIFCMRRQEDDLSCRVILIK